MRASLTLMLVLLATACCPLVPSCEAGVFLDRVGQTAKDVGERVQQGAKKIETGIRNLFGGEDVEDKASEGDDGRTTTTTMPPPRKIIGSAKRCAPGETFFANECRSAD